MVGSATRGGHVLGCMRGLSSKVSMPPTSSSADKVLEKVDNTAAPLSEKIDNVHESMDYYDGRNHEFSASRSRDIVDYGQEHSAGLSSHDASARAIDYNSEPVSVAQGMAEISNRGSGIDSHRADIISHNSTTSISLNSCMQSNVPEPFNPQGRNPTHVNMPGGGILRSQKYVYGDLHKYHPSKQFSTSAALKALAEPEPTSAQFDIPCPQGIQGDDCVHFKIWYANCRRFNLSNCDEQLASLQSGRKTLAQVFNEQDLLIREVVEGYEKKLDSETELNVQAAFEDVHPLERRSDQVDDMQGLQDVPMRLHGMSVEELAQSQTPCPQGVQGVDCERFKVWLQNCSRFGMGHCNEQLGHLQSGRKTLSQIFQEQDQLLENIARQHRRSYSTGPGQQQPSDPTGSSEERH